MFPWFVLQTRDGTSTASTSYMLHPMYLWGKNGSLKDIASCICLVIELRRTPKKVRSIAPLAVKVVGTLAT